MTAEQTAGAGRRGFVRIAGLGLGSAALAAVSGTKPWAALRGTRLETGSAELLGDGKVPLAGALALVLLASWGVVLVTRGAVRRAMAGVIALSAVGYLVASVWGVTHVCDDLVRQVGPMLGGGVQAELTGWAWVALVAAVGATGTGVVAVMQVRTWPEMGSRYDAPSAEDGAPGPGTRSTPVEEADSLTVWKALDEGEDPTRDAPPRLSSERATKEHDV